MRPSKIGDRSPVQSARCTTPQPEKTGATVCFSIPKSRPRIPHTADARQRAVRRAMRPGCAFASKAPIAGRRQASEGGLRRCGIPWNRVQRSATAAKARSSSVADNPPSQERTIICRAHRVTAPPRCSSAGNRRPRATRHGKRASKSKSRPEK